jgi:CubicO group peptidase (beta-lactamase class C family)
MTSSDVAASEVKGDCSERFEPVRDTLAEKLASGDELGASIVINIEGEVVADIWGGFRDEARTVPWTEDTITNVWSTTKTITNLAALMLADRG